MVFGKTRNRTNTRGGVGQQFTQGGRLTQNGRDSKSTLLRKIHKRRHNSPHVTPKDLTTEALTIFEVTEELVKK